MSEKMIEAVSLVAFLFLFLLAATAVVYLIIRAIHHAQKIGKPLTTFYTAATLFCFASVLLSGFFNIGWIRFILIVSGIALVHPIALIVIIHTALKFVDWSASIKVLIVSAYITYVLGYFLLPDGGDIGPVYMFFGLIRTDVVVNLAFLLSPCLLIANAVILIALVVTRFKLGKQMKRQELEKTDLTDV